MCNEQTYNCAFTFWMAANRDKVTNGEIAVFEKFYHDHSSKNLIACDLRTI